jgi:hypothetical protein
MPSPSDSLPPALAAIRGNKPLLYLLAGGLGGAAGAVLAEGAMANFGEGLWARALMTGCWAGAFAAVLAASLYAAGEFHARRDIRPRGVTRLLMTGGLAGLLSGVLAETAFAVRLGPDWVHGTFVRTVCWSIMGGMLGFLLARSVPNLGKGRGALAGLIGGGLGGIGFLAVGFVLSMIAAAMFGGDPEKTSKLVNVLARLLGLSILGFALGLAMLVVEKLFCEASLEVIWAPNETTNLNLGTQAVTIGGGEDHVFVRGLPHHFASIVFSNGVIEYVETASGKRSPLKDGSRLEIGKLNLVIHAAK